MKTKDCTCGREGSDKKHTSGIHRGLALSHRTKAVYQTDTPSNSPLVYFLETKQCTTRKIKG